MDDYLSTLDPDVRAAFARVRDIALEVVPDAEQGRSYGLPALLYRGRPLLGFQATARHLAVYPFSPAVVDAVRGRLTGPAPSKGTIRFTAAAPLPADVVREVVTRRVSEIDS
jgi:uncharacterized protein YdhG (YjbR/CyaY superfamily)